MPLLCLRSALSVLFLVVFVGQSGKGEDRSSVAGLSVIHRILRSGNFSGSLAYSGCGFDTRVPPDLPPMGILDESGTTRETLSKLFSADPIMQVTQEDGNTIRMMEKNVPTDILNLMIHHLSFFPSDAPNSGAVHGPGMALLVILRSPEVMAFRKENHIDGWASPLHDGIVFPGDCCGGSGRIVHGELNDVTVSQALDYVLKTFPGFWLYENCVNKEGWRSIYINFH